MTDRHAAYLVTLDRDIREDDAEESILIALRMLKGVVSVKPIEADAAMQAAEERVRWDMRRRIRTALDEAIDGPAT